MLVKDISSIYEGTVLVNENNRIVFKVEDLGEFSIHLVDLDKHKFKQSKKDQYISKAKALCFLYRDSYDGFAGYVYPTKLELINEVS